MLFKKQSPPKAQKVAPPEPKSEKQENPKICIELLPNGKVLPSVFWKPHANVNIKLMSEIINLLNAGEFYEPFKTAIAKQGIISGDEEVAAVMLNKLTDPKSIDDEEPLIPADMVTRLHFSQQRINTEE